MKSGKDCLTVISLFTGAMGLDLGFEMEGFDIRVALDNNPDVIETIKKNRPNIPIITQSIFDVNTDDILKKAKLDVGEATVVTGGPPCQSFSTAGKRLSVEEKRGECVFEHLRVINEAKPEFFVFENVTGLLSSAIRHVSFYERIGKKEEALSPEERLGSAFEVILEEFKKTGYAINWNVVNSADYGAPQKRKRFVMLGSRNGKKIPLPPTTHASPKSLEAISGQKKPWTTLREAFKDLNEEKPEFAKFPRWGKYMKHIPQGGCWRNLPEELKKEAMGGAFYSQGGRTGFYRRLSWDEPSPTLVTSPIFKGTVLAHPEEDRALSIREYARIQGFPDDWVFIDSTEAKYRIIGEAVPIPLSRAIARQIFKEITKGVQTEKSELLESAE
jgi:DNA (cytosine-5)-methyltransferase 1